MGGTAMRILFIGGTGEISYECLRASAGAGHDCTVFNRGRDPEPLPDGVSRIVGDINDPVAYAALARADFDAVCQFKAYTVADARRDVELFSGHCGQYIFISTASAYHKPPLGGRITEATPLHNPYWAYSQAKADMELVLFKAHAAGRLPLTVVRPSHTYRRRFPGMSLSGDDQAWRIQTGRPVVIHGDDSLLWTLTHARDFATLFVPLLGRREALGEAFHVVTDTAFTFEQMYRTIAGVMGAAARFAHVPVETLVKAWPDCTGPLLGDKGWTTLFDTSKLERISGRVARPVPLADGFAAAWPYVQKRLQSFTPDLRAHDLLDRLAAGNQ
ncbi:MAG: NAD-dependent epimerase/dehydratase family protein [Tepidisphaerales bacterium]